MLLYDSRIDPSSGLHFFPVGRLNREQLTHLLMMTENILRGTIEDNTFPHGVWSGHHVNQELWHL